MKIKELQGILQQKKSDFALFCSLGMHPDPNIVYFSGYTGLGSLVVPKKQKPLLVVPKMELERAKKSGIKRVYAMNKKKFFESICQILKKNKIAKRTVSIDNNNFNLGTYTGLKKQFKKIKTNDVSLECLQLRQIKTEKEIRIIKKAFSLANNILKKAINNFKDFETESKVAAFLEYEAKKLGLQVAFPPIVASGRNSAIPHHEPKNTKIKKGFCVMDFGVKYNGYCTDITRTVYKGKISRKETAIYDFLLCTQDHIIKKVKIGDGCGKVYESCVKNLNEYSKYFTHGLGHGVGIEIHELPNLTLNSKDIIQKNMAFTIEPGIYIPKKYGIRIEDTILMKTKPVILTDVRKDLIAV
jgi:Xaa-Pro aminopeptidase